LLIVHQSYKNRNGHLPEKKKRRNSNDYSFFLKKENYILFEIINNKMVEVHQQTRCGIPRATKAGNQPEHTMDEL